MTERLVWARDGRDWPHREASRFVLAGGLRWHVQQMGDPSSPAMLLIHGTGAATHSWRGLMPLLAERCHVVAADLPGHAFTDTPASAQALTLPGMAQAMGALANALQLDVAGVLGHSAGAAIAARMVLDGVLAPRALLAVNGAFLPLGGLPGLLFPPAARLMAATPIGARLFAWRASDRAAVERLIAGTGSRLDATGIALYARLVRDVSHVGGALGMMANWDLVSLARDLQHLQTPLHLLVGADDKAVPLWQADRVRGLLPRRVGSTLQVLQSTGHLAHEERPDAVAAWVLKTVSGVTKAATVGAHANSRSAA